MMQIDWDALKPEHLPGDLGEIARECGLDVARYLVESWGGAMIYIPTLQGLRKEHRDRRIIEAFDGTNGGLLAAKLGVSRRYITRLLRDADPDRDEKDGDRNGGGAA